VWPVVFSVSVVFFVSLVACIRHLQSDALPLRHGYLVLF
jgi:hypothetical protein